MDENVERAVTEGLRERGVNVLTAQQDGHAQTDDAIVFDRADALGRVLASEDTDMLRESTGRLRRNEQCADVVFWHQQTLSMGKVISDLELLASAGTAEDVQNRVIFLPL